MRYLIIILISIYTQLGLAALDIEITQGVDSAVPIAVYPFDIIYDDKQELSQQLDLSVLTNVIAKDLYRSGLFNSKLQEKQNSKINIHNLPIENLQQDNIEYVITGTVHVQSNNQLEISVQLINLYQVSDLLDSDGNAPGKQDLNNAVLFNKTYSVDAIILRNLAHHISDQLFEQLTGIKGIFLSKIAYVNAVWRNKSEREYTLEVSDSDGFNPKKILVSSQPIMSPSWHPNGKEIAYVSFSGNRSKINTIDLATGNIKTLTAFKGINGAPVWSPDGTKMAVVLSKEKVPKIYIADFKNNTLKQITKGTAIDTEPRWAPNGKSIIFTSNRGGGPQIYQYDFDSKEIERLTFEGSYNARASFTPDGTKLVMVHRPKDQKDFKIAVQDLGTYNLDVLTDSSMDESPSVSANGQQIIYATMENGKGILAEVSIDGRVKIRRPAKIGDVQEPAWSPYLG